MLRGLHEAPLAICSEREARADVVGSSARGTLGKREFSRAEYAALFPALSMPTASRDLRGGVDAGVLVRRGDKATARYRFSSR